MYSQLTLESGLRTEAGERIGSSITGVRKTGYSYEIGSLSHHICKNQLRPEVVSIRAEKHKLTDIGQGNNVFVMTSKAKVTQAKTDK